MSQSSATASNMSSAPTGSAAPLTPDLLRRFLIDAPSVFKDKLQRGNEKQILSNCYRSLWSNNLDWMQRYFFKEGLTDNESLTQLLERHDLFGAVGTTGNSSASSSGHDTEDNDDTSMNIIQSNPDNVLVDSTQDEPEYWESQRGKQCGHLFKKGESVYRCRNCGLDDTCVMCSRCFHATNHDGHDVKIWISRGAGGCCDCGDPEAWKIPLECRIHSLSATHNDAGVKIVRPTMEPYDTIPTELLNSIHDTIAVVLDYLLETFAASPEDVSPGSIMDVLKDCEESHAALGIRDTSKERRSAYSCVLWNDERHSFEEVNDIVVRATKCSKAAAQKVAENVDAYGRHVILISENLKEAMKVALQINSINLAVTVRSTENTLREEICGLLLEWLKDLVSGRFKFFTSVEGGTSILRDTLCKVLCEEWTLRPDLAALSTRSRRGRRMDVDTDDDFDAQEMDIPDDDEDDGDVDEDGNPTFLMQPLPMMDAHILDLEDIDEIIADDNNIWHDGDDDEDGDEVIEEDNGSDDNDDTEYHDADDDIEMHDATTSTALTRLFSEVINDPNNSSVTTTQHSVSSDDNNHPQQITTAASAADTTSTLLEQPGSTRRRHSNTTQQKKQQSDIVDIGYDLDEWLAHTEKLDKFERELAQSLGIPLSSPSKPVSEANKSLKKEFKRKLRLDYLLQFDLRLWKLARASIKDILIGTLISNFDYRPVLGTRFARNYPDLVDAFFFKDREPEHSVSSLSVQLLTVPTVAWMLVKEYKFFGIVSSILSNFFLTDHIHMLLPENYRKMQVDCRSRSITRHRYAYTFFDLRYVLNADLVRVEVSQGPVYLRHFLDVLYQFQAMDPLERQMDTHVEYESSSWVSAFNVTLQVSKLCRLFAGCFSPHLLSSSPTSDKLTTAEAARNLCRSIYRVLHQIGEWDPHKSTEQQSIEGDISAANDGGAQLLIRGVNQQKFQTIKTPYSGTFDVVDYDVAKEPVSFHHPFHWLLSELLEHISLLQADLLADLGWTGGFKQMIQMPSSQLPYDLFLTILDYPLRTIVMLAQINCGVWVRNGYGIRNQARTYRDISVRENTFDRDIYLLQVGFVATNPDHLLVTMLDRFKLWNWFNGKTHKAHPDYEASQLIFIVEEFLNLLAICATERGYASAMSTEDQIRRSIIQYLGISSLAYSELVKLVPESLSENESFETILDTLATYKAPDGLNDHGLYELKDEFYSELDPYFWHFTRNHREEALEALRKHWKKHHPDEKLDDKEEFMVIPQLVNIESGPFTHLGDFLHSATLCQIITHALWNTKVSPNPSDTVLETTLYLAMLAVTTEDRTQTSRDTKGKQRAEAMETSDDIERQSGFIHHAITKEYAITINSIERIHTTLLTVLLKCLDDNDLKHVHKRLHFIVEKIEQQGSDEAKSIIREWRQAFDQAAAVAEANQTASSAQSEYERKKAAAKARQAAIMSQFAQAQSQFMSQHGELYDDEDDDELAAFEDGNDDMTKNDILPETVDGELEVERLCHFPAGTCIVCQEELDRNKLYGVLGLIQNSHILRQTPLKNSNILVDICETAQGKNPAIERTEAIPGQKTDLHGFPSDAHFAGAQVSSCGHLMHAQCFKNYQASVENEVLGSLREIMPTFAPRRRFLCPLCKALGNTLLPVVWKGKTESFPGVMAPHSRYELTGERLDDAIQHYSQQRHQEEPTTQIPGAFHSSSLLSDSAAAIINNHDANLTPDKLESLSELYQQLMKTLEMIRANDKMDSQLLIVDTRKPLMQLFDMYAYTIASIEIGQRGVDESSSKRDLTVEYTGTFLDGISIQTQTLLKILAKTNDLLPKALNINMISENRHSMKRLALSTLRQVMYQDLPFSADGVDKPHITPLLCDDPFSVLTRLGFCVLNDDDCGLEVHHLMRLLLLAEITKTVIALMQGLTGSEQMEDVRVMESLQQVMTSETWNDNTTTATSVRQFAESIMQILEVPSSFVEDFFRQIDPQVLVALIHTFTLPFLRKCLFLMVVHHGFVPQSPNDDLGLDEDIDKKNSTLDEYNHLLSILRLPAFDQLFSLEDFEQQILTTWCQHYRDHSLNMQPINESSSSSAGMVMKGGQTPAYARLVQLNLNLPTPFSMVSLPYRMDQLFDESSRRVCRNCKTIPEDPALCLMCGTFVCARRYCCMTRDRGECNTHMRMCGGEIGIYMVIKECFILFLHDNGGTIMSAPYLDAHGEVDLFLKRGAPQYLNSKRYEQLRQMWLSHSIPAFVRRRMEVSYNYQRWENW